jgi:hypothetical protein
VYKETGSCIELLGHRISSGDVKITGDFVYFVTNVVSWRFFPLRIGTWWWGEAVPSIVDSLLETMLSRSVVL